MAKEYLDKKTRAAVAYLKEFTDDMPSYGKNFIVTLLQGSKDGKIPQHALGTSKEYALALKKFLNATVYSPERMPNEPKGLSRAEVEQKQLEYLQSITAEQLDSFLEKDKISDNFKRNKTQALKAFYAYLHSEGLIGLNPLISYKPPIGKRAPKRSICFTASDKEKLIKAVSETEGIEGKKELEIANKTALRDTIIVLLIIENGFSVTDITALDITDYDTKKHTLARTSTDKREKLEKRTVTLLDRYLGNPQSVIPDTQARSSFGPKEDDKQALFIGRKRERLAERSVTYMLRKLLRRTFGDDCKFTPRDLQKGVSQ